MDASHPFCTEATEKRKPVVVGTLADAKENGVAGTVGCAGCASTKGTLEGPTFRCNTKGCKYESHPTPSHPWSKKR